MMPMGPIGIARVFGAMKISGVELSRRAKKTGVVEATVDVTRRPPPFVMDRDRRRSAPTASYWGKPAAAPTSGQARAPDEARSRLVGRQQPTAALKGCPDRSQILTHLQITRSAAGVG